MAKIAVVIQDGEGHGTLLRALAEEGHEVVLLDDPQNAPAKVVGEQAELVVIDASLNGGAGLNLGWILKQTDQGSELPLIYLLPQRDEGLISRCLNHGADMVMVEPFSVFEFILAVRSELERYHYLREIKRQKAQIEAYSRRLKEELEAARQAQESLLPLGEHRVMDGLTAEGFFQPCESLGGDFFDYFAPQGSPLIYGIFADVSGHGVRSALYASQIKSLFLTFAGYQLGVPDLLAELNQVLLREEEQFYATCIGFTLTLDGNHYTLSYVSCGHPDFMLITPEGQINSFPSTTFPLGLLPEVDLTMTTIVLSPPLELLFYSDALLERRSPEGELFGPERLRDLVGQMCREGKQLEWLHEELNQFSGGAPLSDDVSMLRLRIE